MAEGHGHYRKRVARNLESCAVLQVLGEVVIERSILRRVMLHDTVPLGTEVHEVVARIVGGQKVNERRGWGQSRIITP